MKLVLFTLLESWLLISAYSMFMEMSQEVSKSEKTSVEGRQSSVPLFNPLVVGSYALLGAYALYSMNKRGYFDKMKHGWAEARGNIVGDLKERIDVATDTFQQVFRHSKKEYEELDAPSNQNNKIQNYPTYQRFSRAMKMFSEQDSDKIWKTMENKILEFLLLYNKNMEERSHQQKTKQKELNTVVSESFKNSV